MSTGTADKRSLVEEKAEEKVESNVGFKLRDFLGSFKALVRGARTQAAEQRKLW